MKFRDRQLDQKQVAGPDVPGNVRPAIEKLVKAHNDTQAQLREALAGGLSTVENTIATIRDITFRMPAEPFVALSLSSPWAESVSDGSFSPAIMMMPGGEVRFRGAIKGGTPALYNTATAKFATLAEGFRPGAVMKFAVDGGVDGIGMMEVHPDGEMHFTYSQADVVQGHLDGIRYFADSPVGPSAFVGDGWPMVVRHGFQKCRSAEILGLEMVERMAGRGQAAGVLDWRDLGDGTIAIDGIWGCQWKRFYRGRLRLSPEESER